LVNFQISMSSSRGKASIRFSSKTWPLIVQLPFMPPDRLRVKLRVRTAWLRLSLVTGHRVAGTTLVSVAVLLHQGVAQFHIGADR
jgi:hypothetical protein